MQQNTIDFASYIILKKLKICNKKESCNNPEISKEFTRKPQKTEKNTKTNPQKPPQKTKNPK